MSMGGCTLANSRPRSPAANCGVPRLPPAMCNSWEPRSVNQLRCEERTKQSNPPKRIIHYDAVVGASRCLSWRAVNEFFMDSVKQRESRHEPRLSRRIDSKE